eukprot:scaffold14417_cov76-Skeletonema_dohrnii-CCMP3373.AAC.3
MPLSDDQREYLRQQGTNINQHGTISRSGASLPYTKKLEVVSAYSTERDAAGGKRPNISAIGISRGCVARWRMSITILISYCNRGRLRAQSFQKEKQIISSWS